MNELACVQKSAIVAASSVVPLLVAASGTDAIDRFLNFFATQIENDNTREAYLRAARKFLGWCEQRALGVLPDILPIHVAVWIKELKATHAVPTVKLRLSAIRHLFDWLVTGHGTSCVKAKRRSPIVPRRVPCSIASAARRPLICATRR